MFVAAVYALAVAACARADVPIGGFVPFVGIGLTNQFETFDSDPDGTFFIADPSFAWGGTPLGPGSTAYFDIALLDTGAAVHVLTQPAASASGFSIQSEGFRGTNFQTIGGATGEIDLRINDPLGIYAAGLGDRTGAGTSLAMNTAALRGQTSVSTLEAPAEWTLPNIVGLPMAAHHAIVIRNDQPQIFQHQGRTMRTPQIDLIDLGTGGEQGILRRTDLNIRPGIAFITGPQYVQNLDIIGGNFNFHDNPLSPTVITDGSNNGGLFVEVDMALGSRSFQDKELLFDTGADLTVISQVTASRLGFDAVLDTPDFFLEVEGSGGVSSGVPGIFLDELNIDTVGGSFTLTNVPVAVLDVTDPTDPGNIIDGIIGMHLFNGRNLVIDANPSTGQGGVGPSLYISDPVTEAHSWASTASLAPWHTASSWSAPGAPGIMWAANVANVSGSNQVALVAANSTVFELQVSGTPSAQMTVHVQNGATLSVFGEARIETGGQIELGGGTLDAQFVNIDGGTLYGEGEVFVGTGPIHSPVRNISGRIEPGDPIGQLTIDGDLSQQEAGTLAFELGGTVAISQYDRLAVDRFAFLDGTLEVTLADAGSGMFTPSVGNSFTILTSGEGIQGTFDDLLLPAGFTWNVTYGANSVMLSVTGLGLAGDFTGDGSVDTADYIVWRKTSGSLPEYNDWRSNFGRTNAGAGSSTSVTSAVPEPSGVVLSVGGLLAAAVLRQLNGKRRIYSARSVRSVDVL
jgi:hypothetical protein